MKRYINRILFAVVALFAMAGTAKGQTLASDGSVTNADVKWFVSDTEPTAAPSGDGAASVSITAGQWVIIKVTPNEGYWICNDKDLHLLTLQPVGGTGGAEARQRAVILPANPTALSTSADGTGYYYYQIPATCTAENGYTKVIVAGSAIEKIDLSTATRSTDGKTITTKDRTDGWKAEITLDEVSFTYNGSAQGPKISSFSLSNGTKTFAAPEVQADKDVQVSISNNSQTNASTTAYNATLTAVATGCLKNSFSSAAFSIGKKALTITAKPQSVNYGTAITQGTDQVTPAGLISGHTLTAITLTQSTTNVTTTGTITPSAATVKSGDTDVTANYDITYSPGELIINAADAATAVVTANDRTYDGTAKALVTIGAITDGATGTAADVVFYESATGTTPLTAVPQGTNAGDYDVYYEVTPDANHTKPARAKRTVTISKAALTITADDKIRKFGETNPELTVSYSGFVNNETSDVLTTKPTASTEATAESAVGTYDITVSGAEAANYTITYKKGTLTVNQNTIVVGGDDDATATAKLVVDPTEFTYNGKDQKPTVKVVMKADNKEIASTEYEVKYQKGETDVTETKDAGTYTVVITNKTGSDYAFSGATTASYEIKPATLTITAKDKTISFGDEAANDGVSYSGFVNEETSAVLSGTLTYTYKKKEDGTGDDYTKESPVGTYYIIPSGLTSTNYTITFVAGKLTVSKDVIVIGGDDDATATAKLVVDPTEFTYNGKDQKPTVKVVMKADNKEIASTEYEVKYQKGETDVTETKDAGTYTVVITNKTGSDYAFSGATTASYVIKPAALTVTAKDKTISYGDAAANDGVTYSGFVEGEDEKTAGIFGGELSYSYNSKDDGTGDPYTTASPVGTYYIIPAGLTSTNYAITFAAGKLTVSKNPIVIGGDDDPTATATIEVDPTEFTYNGKDQKPTVKVVMKADKTEIPATEYDVKYQKGSTDVTETKDAATYTVVITNKDGSDYAFSGATTASYVIKPAALTVTAKDKTISYGDAAANDGVTYSGFVEGEDENTAGIFGGELSYSYNSKDDGTGDPYTTSSPVGTYYIIPAGLTSTNYAITFAAGKLTVSKNPIVIGGDDDPTATATIEVDPTEFTYNGKDQKPTVKVVMKADKTEIPATEYDVKYQRGSTDVTETKDAGTYTVVITNKDGSDYAFSGATTASYVINPAALTVTAKDKTISYGDAAANDGVTYSGFVEGEDENTSGIFGGELSYSYKTKADGTGDDYTTSSPVGTYYIIPAGLTSTNYTITFVAGELTVSENSIVIGGDDDPTATAKLVVDPTAFTYNGKDQKPSVKVVMKADGKEIPATEYDVKYQKGSTDVTETKDAGTYTVVIINKKGSDYAFSGKTTADYVINPAALTITADAKTKVFGEEDPSLTYTSSGLVGTDAITGDLTRDEGEDAGTYAITQGTLTAGDNYTITYKGANLTITKADPTLTPPTAKSGLVEDGSTQELVNPGSVTGGTLEYSLNGTTWSTNIPTGSYAGDYTVYYRVTGDKNHNDIAAATLQVTIDAEENPGPWPVDRKHSGIRVVRNDTEEQIDNDVYLSWANLQLRIDRIELCETKDLETLKQVGVSIYIPEELKTPYGTEGKTYGLVTDVIKNINGLPVTDIYMPETEEMLNVDLHAFRLDAKESTTAFIHVPLHLLDDYALTLGLQAEYEAGKVMTTIEPSTALWTFSSAVDVVIPDGLTANTCQSKGNTQVAFNAITDPSVEVDGTMRTLIKANNGVLMMGSATGSYDLRAWPSDDRPSGLSPIPVENANSYPDNELEPSIVPTHFKPTQYYILLDNTFRVLDPEDKTSVHACKAVLRKTSNLQARTLTIVGGEGTGIERPTPGPSLYGGEWYDLQGRKLNGKPQRAGVYIHNGKQEIVK